MTSPNRKRFGQYTEGAVLEQTLRGQENEGRPLVTAVSNVVRVEQRGLRTSPLPACEK